MTPGQQEAGGGGTEGGQERPKLVHLREMLPCLAIPDEIKAVEKAEKVEEKQTVKEEDGAVDSMMDFLESMAPSKKTVEETGRKLPRNRSPSLERRRSRSRERRRSRERGRGGAEAARRVADRIVDKEEVEQWQVYSGKVQNITNFGCFVQLLGFRRKVEGLVHISQLRREGRE